jgi:hypothetical protein
MACRTLCHLHVLGCKLSPEDVKVLMASRTTLYVYAGKTEATLSDPRFHFHHDDEPMFDDHNLQLWLDPEDVGRRTEIGVSVDFRTNNLPNVGCSNCMERLVQEQHQL